MRRHPTEMLINQRSSFKDTKREERRLSDTNQIGIKMLLPLLLTRECCIRRVKSISANGVKIPRSGRDAGRSKYADFWREAQRDEMEAMQKKGVLE